MKRKKPTLVVGASLKPHRYSNKAIRKLRAYGHPVYAVGLREGEVDGVPVRKEFPQKTEIDTVTMYVGPERQPPLYDPIFEINPRRIIFNPGTENPELLEKAHERGIETVEHCTLVMLGEGSF